MLLSIVPDNVVGAASNNASILALMFFALMFGVGIVVSKTTPGIEILRRGIEGLFEVSMTLIGLVIKLAPYAVFCFMFNLAVLFGWELLVRLGAYVAVVFGALVLHTLRSEEHTSELQSLMRISYAVFCLKKKKT